MARPGRAWIWPVVLGLGATLTWSAPATAGADAGPPQPAGLNVAPAGLNGAPAGLNGAHAGLKGAPVGLHEAPAGLKEAIDEILTDPRLAGGAASVVVADAAGGEVLYEHRPTDRLLPASNTKLITSAAAMELLGPGYRFRTDVLTEGRQTGPVLDGDLYLRGGGDPTMLAKDYDALAKKIADTGVRKVTGRLVADDTRFDAERLGRSWAADDESAYYAAQISPLSVAPDTDYDAGSLIVETRPGASAGDRVTVTPVPGTGYVRIDNRATTAARGAPTTLSVQRRHGGNTLTVTGAVPVGAAPVRQWISVWEPTGHAAAVFADALKRHGVHLAGPTRLGLPTPSGARPLAVHRSMPLKKLLVPFMKLSNNIHAEVLTKTLGYEAPASAGRGTWSAGLTAIRGFLEKEGVDTATLRQADGSGLSRLNALPARQLARLLVSVRDADWYPDWHASLPVACAPDRMVGGTLRTRMCRTPAAGNAHAKTGSLTGASALSGYVKDARGRELAFSIVLGGYLAPSVKSVEDAIVVTLASSGRGRVTAVRPKAMTGGEESTDVECSWVKAGRC
ncbi:D-alanyl-D-alanine carboxypeptidase/D-alanyl-D-alanine-endopeptidase [Streptomyces sp. LX-29]|uniref:D-alanyl-D-alanine carboxypeptidase/D-alanyl-D-alanine endopeptidase n=1 Tax=Streptomyces sp. LX-29 TaxID=2900152 RepID=UPI00240D4904|nr:D-alanyl-D-alanine carboxypeptidase/D-alanyl-D-alanine-endopeptidase [Streptomyces sp. LX-29]WFB09199.1 D-alanyl-D-alanine carboxypeptidase/D-alanyl-D-alanine-endopeptidase [Streptomyces sp. LX-29]